MICPSGPGLLLHIVPATKETRTIVVAAKNEGAPVLKKDAHRATRGNDPAKREHLEVHLYVEQVVTKRWEQGDAIGREELKEKVKSKFIKSNQTNFINSYLDPDKKGSFAKFITRSIQYFGFTSRCKSVSQKIPQNWLELTIAGALHARITMRKAKVEVLISADEMFTKFHESCDKVLVPLGTK
jgi:hypothetical protein